MYKIGFFFNITGFSKHRLILCYNGSTFYFKNVSYKLIDYQPNVHISNMGRYYYNLDYPVIYYDNGCSITSVFFLMNIPFQIKEKFQEMKGFTYTKSMHESKENDVTLFLDGKPIQWKEQGLSSKECEFCQNILNLHACKSIKSFLYRDAVFELPNKYINPSLKEIKEYVNNIDIDILLSTIHIEYKDSHRSKIGGDDTYWVYRETKTDSNIIKSDKYLLELFKIGTDCVQEERGYTSHFVSKFPIGKCEGDILKKEKEKIKDKYSIIDHTLSLITEKRDSALQSAKKIPFWEERIKYYTNLIMQTNIEKIKDVDERLFYPLHNNNENSIPIIERINIITDGKVRNFPKFNVVVTGDKKLADFIFLKKQLENILKNYGNYDVSIVQGNADGVEKMAQKFSIEENYNLITCTYDWFYPETNYIDGRRPTRIEALLKEADALVLVTKESPTDEILQLVAQKGIFLIQIIV